MPIASLLRLGSSLSTLLLLAAFGSVTASLRAESSSILRAPITSSAAVDAPETVNAALQQMANRAGIIFAGEVVAIRHPKGIAGSPQQAAEGMIEIEFQVDLAVQGCTENSHYILREWAGLWAGGIERYQVGQRLMMFLHTPNASGMSSPVDGMDGAMPLMGSGVAPAATDTLRTPGKWMVDTRWVQTHVKRATVMSDNATANEVKQSAEDADKAIEGLARNNAEQAMRAGEPTEASIFAEPVALPGAASTWRPVSAMPKQSTTSLEAVLTLCQQEKQAKDAAR